MLDVVAPEKGWRLGYVLHYLDWTDTCIFFGMSFIQDNNAQCSCSPLQHTLVDHSGCSICGREKPLIVFHEITPCQIPVHGKILVHLVIYRTIQRHLNKGLEQTLISMFAQTSDQIFGRHPSHLPNASI